MSPFSPSALVAAVFLLVLLSAPAEAYIDPGHGSLFFQYVIGLILGALIYARNAVRKLFSAALRKLRSPFRREG